MQNVITYLLSQLVCYVSKKSLLLVASYVKQVIKVKKYQHIKTRANKKKRAQTNKQTTTTCSLSLFQGYQCVCCVVGYIMYLMCVCNVLLVLCAICKQSGSSKHKQQYLQTQQQQPRFTFIVIIYTIVCCYFYSLDKK